MSHLNSQQPRSNISEILQQVSLLNSPDHAKNAMFVLTKLVENEDFEDTALADCGVVPALVRHLQVPEAVKDDAVENVVAKGCAFILGYLAVNVPEHQQLIVDAGALPCLVDLLKRHKNNTISRPLFGLLRNAAAAISRIACENTIIKTLVRMEGGIPPLVELLEFNAKKVQIAAALALGTLALNNDENKNQIVECNALPSLVLMLRSEDPTIHYVAVNLIGILVHSSLNIQKEALLAGALQPIICLLSSCCPKSQKEAATLLGQFVALDSDFKVHISQRGAIPRLVNMLKSPDAQLQKSSAFVLGRLAQDSHNQAGIGYAGGTEHLLDLLDSSNEAVLQQAVFALYGLADNEENAADIIKAGGFQKLKHGHFKDQFTKEYVVITLKRLKEKMQGRVSFLANSIRVLKHLIYVMRFEKKEVQRHVAFALAYSCSPHDRKSIFVDNNGLELLLDMLKSPNAKEKGDGSAAIHKLVVKASSSFSSPTTQIYLGEEYVNNAKLSDVTFLVEGRCFYARRDCLLSSDIFRAMFDGGYSEREAKHVVIPNIKWDVFELMMRFMCTGTVDVNLDIALDLFRAADQYLLNDLKRICEYAIFRGISVENVSLVSKMAEDFNAIALKNLCKLFMLEKCDELRSEPWYYPMVDPSIVPEEIRMLLSTLLIETHPVGR